MARTRMNAAVLVSIPILMMLSWLLIAPSGANGQIQWNCATANAEFGSRSCHQSVVFNNKLWVLNGFGNAVCSDIWYSPTGKTWSRAAENVPYPMRTYFAALAFKEYIWVIGGYEAC